MDAEKRSRLESDGFAFGDYGDFLDLTDEDREQVEMAASLRGPSIPTPSSKKPRRISVWIRRFRTQSRRC